MTVTQSLKKRSHWLYALSGLIIGLTANYLPQCIKNAEATPAADNSTVPVVRDIDQLAALMSSSAVENDLRYKLKKQELDFQELERAYTEVTDKMNTLQYGLFKSFENIKKLRNKYSDLAFVLEMPEAEMITFSNSVLPTQVKANSFNLLMSSIPLSPVLDEKFQITSGYGSRNIKYEPRASKFHQAVDFGAPVGTPIYAPADGYVEVIRPSNSKVGNGNFIRIDHSYGFATSYSHLDSFNVSNNQFVRKGDVIGFTGETGLSTGPHLHYEVILGRKKLNPEPFLEFHKNPSWENLAKIKGVPWDDFEIAMKETSMKSALVFR